jgi:ribulose-5-phosphate 4-epimerase/fuculose-1-phosphate aldolase
MKKLIELSKKVSPFCVGMEGNISGKTDKGLLIKASGARLSSLKKDDLVEFDMNNNQISNFTKKGSMELSFHTFLLGFDNINYVSHTHPVNTLKILCSDLCESFATNRLFPDQVIFNGIKSCLVPYTMPGIELTKMIEKEVKSFIQNEGYFPKLILLKNHGIITCGKTIEECIIATEICEKSAEIFTGISGKINFLSIEESEELLLDKNEKYRQELLR